MTAVHNFFSLLPFHFNVVYSCFHRKLKVAADANKSLGGLYKRISVRLTMRVVMKSKLKIAGITVRFFSVDSRFSELLINAVVSFVNNGMLVYFILFFCI